MSGDAGTLSTPLSLMPMQIGDRGAMDRLLFHAFGPARLDLPSYNLRHGPPLDRLSWVARSPDSQVLGCLRFWQVCLDQTSIRAVLLGPLAVDLAYRGAGVARALVQFGLNRATDMGFDLCFVVGEPRFYRRFGFTNAAWSGIVSPAPIPARRLQVRELKPASLTPLATLKPPLALRALPVKDSL